MPQFTLDIPAGVATEVLDAFAWAYGYDPDSCQTKSDFAKDKVRQFVKEVYTAYKANEAAEVARQTAVSTAETDSDVITVT